MIFDIVHEAKFTKWGWGSSACHSLKFPADSVLTLCGSIIAERNKLQLTARTRVSLSNSDRELRLRRSPIMAICRQI